MSDVEAFLPCFDDPPLRSESSRCEFMKSSGPCVDAGIDVERSEEGDWPANRWGWPFVDGEVSCREKSGSGTGRVKCRADEFCESFDGTRECVVDADSPSLDKKLRFRRSSSLQSHPKLSASA